MRRNPEGAKARIVTDGCRALPLHGRVGRMGQGGGECGSGAGQIPNSVVPPPLARKRVGAQKVLTSQSIVASPTGSGRSIYGGGLI